MSISQIIRSERKSRQMTIDELAQRMSISSTYISKLERGVCTNPSLKTMRKLSNALGVSIDTFTHVAEK